MNSNRTRDVLVIGAGVIGLATAYELARRGVDVAVVDRGAPGHGCSYGNAGWITPSQALPLAQPGMLMKATRWLLDRESPLYIQPRPSWRLASWLIGFVRAMNRAQMLRSVAALVPLTRYGLDEFSRLESETGHSIAFRRRGLLSVAETDAGFASIRGLVSMVGPHGIPARELSAAELRDFEPALDRGQVRGGIFFPEEADVEPLDVVRAYQQGAERRGATVLAHHRVVAFQWERGALAAVDTNHGALRAHRFVLAAGSWSRGLGAQLGVRVPVLGGKGYAVILPPPDPMPLRPILLAERKIAVTPRSDSLRLAGTLELVDGDESITRRRVDAIVKGARAMLPIPGTPELREIWGGLRPCTPDGMPIIGFAPRIPNLLIATGHQMMGLKGAPGTARLAADLLLGAEPGFDPQPYRADRF